MKKELLTEFETRFLNRNEVELLIDLWIFGETDRAMIKRHLLDGITLERLSEEFDVSVVTVKRIIYKAENKLFSILQKKVKNDPF